MTNRVAFGPHLTLLISIALSAALPIAAGSPQRTLTLDQRVAAATAIERVYWAHRTWPADNPGPKPGFESKISNETLRVAVEDSLRQSDALAKLWGHPLTSDQLQAELDRMTTASKAPALLRELLASLGNDPFVAAETLARPALADRLIRVGTPRTNGSTAPYAAHPVLHSRA